MAYDAKTERLIALKKLAGKAQTSNDKGLANEALPSGLTLSSETVFGQEISKSPASTSLYDVTGQVEYLRFQCSFIAGSDTSDGRHGFELKLPSDYQSNSSNPSAGTYPYTNDQKINITSGSLQLVPPSFATSYEGKPFYGGSSTKDSGTQIPVLDARDWYLDYFNGIFFQQDPPGTGDHSNNPDFLEGYLYIGKYLDTVVSEGSSGGGNGDKSPQYLVLAATASLPNERVFTAGTGIKTTDSGAGAAYTVAVRDSIVATLTGSIFSGTVSAPALSGSLTKLQDGTSYIKEGSNVTVTTASNGSITIASTSTTYTAGDGLDLSGTEFSVDLKSSGGLKIDSTELAIDNSIVATLTGSTFSGTVSAPALSGSLTKLQDGTSYLIAGSNTTIATGSSGAITISSTGGIDGSGAASRIATWSDSDTLTSDADLTWNGTTLYVSSAGTTLNVQGDSNLNGTVVINQSGADESFRVETQNKSSALQVDGGTDQVLIFSGSLSDAAGHGSSASDPDPRAFTDTNFFVSGSIDSRGTSRRGTSVFGGDVLSSGSLLVENGITGSLTKLSDGTSYIKEGSNVTVTTASNGSITIASTDTTYTAGDGLDLSGTEFSVDLKSSGGLKINATELAIDDSIVATLTGSQFSGNVGITGSLEVMTGDFRVESTGEDQALFLDASANTFYINKGMSGFTTVIKNTNNEVFRAGAGGAIFNEYGNKFIDFRIESWNKTHALFIDSQNDQVLIHSGGGVTSPDESSYTDLNFFVSGSIGSRDTSVQGTSLFGGDLLTSGSIIALAGLSGSLQQLSDGTSYLREGSNISLTSGSNGSITIAATGGASGAPSDAKYLTLATDNDLTDERVFTAGTGISTTDAGAGSTFTVAIDNSTVATLTGSQFSGNVGITGSLGVESGAVFRSGLSGSLQLLSDGTSYLRAGSNVTITSGSSGTITIASSAISGETRTKQSYFLAADYAPSAAVPVSSSDFSDASYDPDKIDIFVNGMLVHSGTVGQIEAGQRDYYVSSATSLKYSFGLKIGDIIDVVVFSVS